MTELSASAKSATCATCAITFKSAAGLAQHARRKTPCAPPASCLAPELKGAASVAIDDIRTLPDLYKFLAEYPGESILPWLSEPWVGKDKQESLFRIFADLNLFPALEKYEICIGNFSAGTTTPAENLRVLFYDSSGAPVMLKDSGDVSDLTGVWIDPDTGAKTILATTSKNPANKKTAVGALDIDAIALAFAKPAYAGATLVLCIVVPCSATLKRTIARAKSTSGDTVALATAPTTIVLDWFDIDAAFRKFRAVYSGKTLESVLNAACPRAALDLRPHQAMTVEETLVIAASGAKDAVWGHVPRSGKSFVMAAFIARDIRARLTLGERGGGAYLIITTAPNETLDQYEKVLRCADLDDVKVFRLPRDMAAAAALCEEPCIIMCSKQYLQTKFAPVAAIPAPLAESKDAEKPVEKKAIGKKKTSKSAKCMELWVRPSPRASAAQDQVSPELAWLASAKIHARFVDESHFGGATELAQQTLACFGAAAFTVYITATYTKPIQVYNIPRERCITWTLEDIAACKQFADPDSAVAARAREFIYTKYTSAAAIFGAVPPSHITDLYETYPLLTVIARKLTDEVVAELRAQANTPPDVMASSNYGWSAKACLLLKQSAACGKVVREPEFQNPGETLQMMYAIFGKPKDKFNRAAGAESFMDRAREICANGNADARFMPDTSLQRPDIEPAIVMAFLPAANVDATSIALAALIKLHNVLPEYEVCIINSAQSEHPVVVIDKARALAKNGGKRAVLVLSGRQCSLGVTIPGCDVVILLNSRADDDTSGISESGSTDMIYQMMFRSMTEAKGKKFGFVFDLDIQRAMHTIVANARLARDTSGGGPRQTRREAVAYLFRERIVSLNPDQWEPRFGFNTAHREAFFERAYKVYSMKVEHAMGDFMRCIKLKIELFTRNECAFLHAFGKLRKDKKGGSTRLLRLVVPDSADIPDGIEKTAIQRDAATAETEGDNEDEEKEEKEEKEEDEDNRLDMKEMLRSLVPLLVLLTIHSTTTSLRHMLACVEIDATVYEVLMDRTRAWWGDNGTRDTLNLLINIFEIHLSCDDTLIYMENLKDIFVENKNCAAQLSEIIDTYLIPLESEKKAHAEVSTPAVLRKEMLDKMPADFWTAPRKVLEPCAGKGGFLVDMLDRFMVGLEPLYPDEEERRRVIVEECLYWADINPFNVWVCTLLLNLGGERKVNGYLGDSLELNPEKEWGILGGFDAVVGNPPYQATTRNKGVGNTLWNKFVETSLQYWVRDTGLLVFVHPKGWRQIGHSVGAVMKAKQIVYLNMNDVSAGQRMFGCATDYDYYVIENCAPYKATIINDYLGEEYTFDISSARIFIPNHSFKSVFALVNNSCSDTGNGFINDQSSYEPRKSWMSAVKTDTHVYPCIYSIDKSNTPSCKWSSTRENGHFGVSKFIFSNGSGYLCDTAGEYGLTQWAYAIVCKVEDMDGVRAAFCSPAFKKVVDAVRLTSNAYNYRALKLFKKDFWKEFA